MNPTRGEGVKRRFGSQGVWSRKGSQDLVPGWGGGGGGAKGPLIFRDKEARRRGMLQKMEDTCTGARIRDGAQRIVFKGRSGVTLEVGVPRTKRGAHAIMGGPDTTPHKGSQRQSGPRTT